MEFFVYAQLRCWLGFVFAPGPNVEPSANREKWLGLLSDIVLAAIPGVVPMPVVWKWIIWEAAWCAFVYLVLNLNPINRLKRTTKLSMGIIAVLLFAGLTIDPAIGMWREEKASATTGELHSKEVWVNPPQFPRFRIGIDKGPVINWTGSQNRNPMTFFREDDSIRIDIGKTEFELTTLVRDRQGNKVVEVKNNRWEVYPEYSADKNYTRDTLEVQDSRGIPVFHVRLTAQMVELEGEWNSEFSKGRRALAEPTGEASLFIWNNQEKAEEYAPYTLKPIFRYPSRIFWGQYK